MKGSDNMKQCFPMQNNIKKPLGEVWEKTYRDQKNQTISDNIEKRQ
jgi:hypothetical protein